MNLEGQERLRHPRQDGYAMAALLVSLAVMSVLMSVALPVWRHEMQREKEAELIFRGEQYARAIELYQRKYPGAFPPDLDVLVQQRFLRKKYKDPMTEDGEFRLIYATAAPTPGAPGGRAGVPTIGGRGSTGSQPGGSGGVPGARGGIIGVASKSEEASIKIYKGRSRYSEWQFIFAAVSQRPGAVAAPGGPGRRGGEGLGPAIGIPGMPGGRGGRGGRGGEGPGGRGPRGVGPGLSPRGGPPPAPGRGGPPGLGLPPGRGGF